MSNKFDELDEILECAIREKNAIEYMEALDERKHSLMKRRVVYVICGMAACLIIFCGTNIKLKNDIRRAGNAFDPLYGQAGGSEITALMKDNRLDEARTLIVTEKKRLEDEMLSPTSTDPEYTAQLTIDNEELELLDAVCLMRKGQYFKAVKALKKIVSADGAFADEAKKLLRDI